MFRNLPRCNNSMSSLIYIYKYSTQIPSCFLLVLDHSRDHTFSTNATQKKSLYYPLEALDHMCIPLYLYKVSCSQFSNIHFLPITFLFHTPIFSNPIQDVWKKDPFYQFFPCHFYKCRN